MNRTPFEYINVEEKQPFPQKNQPQSLLTPLGDMEQGSKSKQGSNIKPDSRIEEFQNDSALRKSLQYSPLTERLDISKDEARNFPIQERYNQISDRPPQRNSNNNLRDGLVRKESNLSFKQMFEDENEKKLMR